MTAAAEAAEADRGKGVGVAEGGAWGAGEAGSSVGMRGESGVSALEAPASPAQAAGGAGDVEGGREAGGGGGIDTADLPCTHGGLASAHAGGGLMPTAGAAGGPLSAHQPEQAHLTWVQAAAGQAHPAWVEAAATFACAAASGGVGGSWQWARDASTGKLYYYNASTNVVQWEPPQRPAVGGW